MRFSVIIPTFERPDHLREAVQSVAAQTLPAHEIIVVDDGSKADNRPAIEAVPNAKLVRQDNAGQQAARNHGARVATGDWLAFLDDDDLFEPGHLAQIQRAIAQGSPDAVFTNFRRFDADGEEDHSFYARAPGYFTDERLAAGGHVEFPNWPIEKHTAFQITYPSAMAIRRAHYEAVGGFDTDFRGVPAEDIEFILRATLRSPTSFALEPTMRYRRHAGNDAGNALKVELGRLFIWAFALKHHDLQSDEKAHLQELVRERAPHAFRAAFQLKDRRGLAFARQHMSALDWLRPKRWLREAYAQQEFDAKPCLPDAAMAAYERRP